MEEDLFQHTETLPIEVQNVLDEFADKWEDTWEMCRQMKQQLEQLGYTFDYYLNAIPYDLRKIEAN
jgi:hypothetical protein